MVSVGALMLSRLIRQAERLPLHQAIEDRLFIMAGSDGDLNARDWRMADTDLALATAALRAAEDLLALGVSVAPDAPRRGPKWEWDGHAGHFIGASRCLFRLNTRVGRYRISTVGDWFPARAADADEPEALAMNGATHETQVFEVDEFGERLELGMTAETLYYHNDADATAGHFALCQKYEALQAQP